MHTVQSTLYSKYIHKMSPNSYVGHMAERNVEFDESLEVIL